MRKALWTLILSASTLPACSPQHKPTLSRAELLSRPVFAKSLALADNEASAESSSHSFRSMATNPNSANSDPCSAAINPLLQQAQQGIGDLNSSVADSSSALSAATGGNPAAMAALMAAAAQMMQNNQASSSTPTAAATPVASTADSSSPSPVLPREIGRGGFYAGTEDPKGNAGFTNGTQDPSHTGDSNLNSGGTRDSHGAGGGAGFIAGTSGAGTSGAGGSAGFLGSTGEAHSAGSSVNDHAGMQTASVAVSEADGFGGYAGTNGGTAGSSGSALTTHPARGLASLRTPASTLPDLPILHLDGFQDIGVKFSPNLFNLLSNSYGGYCRSRHIN